MQEIQICVAVSTATEMTRLPAGSQPPKSLSLTPTMHRTGDQGNSTLRGWGLRAGEGCKEYKNEKAIIQGSSTYIIDTFLHFTKNKRDSQDWQETKTQARFVFLLRTPSIRAVSLLCWLQSQTARVSGLGCCLVCDFLSSRQPKKGHPPHSICPVLPTGFSMPRVGALVTSVGP